MITVKPKLGFDDSLDAFGIHGIGGIIGSIGTAVTMLPALGGPGAADDYDLGGQLVIQIMAVGVAIVWAGVGSAIAFYIAKLVTGLRVSEEVEREGPRPRRAWRTGLQLLSFTSLVCGGNR